MSNRLSQFQKNLLLHHFDAAFISKKTNLFYLTGIKSLHPTEREAYLIVTPDQAILYHSPFITLPSHLPSGVITLPMSAKVPLSHLLTTYCSSANSLGIEKLDLTVAELERLQLFLPQVTIKPVDEILSTARKIKHKDELIKIKKACQITSKVMKWIQTFCATPAAIGITEKDLVRLAEHQGYQLHADGLAFPTIIAFDAHTALPHHTSDHTRLTKDSIILVDMGFEVEGYLSDMTRTWTIAHSPSPLFVQVEKIVKTAYQAAKKVALSGHSTAAQVDTAARSIITSAGFGDTFIHTTGHGLGLEAHEPPSVNSHNQEEILPGMAITIEPGIYLPAQAGLSGKFGYRHEDTILIS